MRLAKAGILAGLPALAARVFLRRARFTDFHREWALRPSLTGNAASRAENRLTPQSQDRTCAGPARELAYGPLTKHRKRGWPAPAGTSPFCCNQAIGLIACYFLSSIQNRRRRL